MNKIDIIKKVGSIVISAGVGSIVGNVIKSTTPSTASTLKRVCIGVGAFVLINMISDKAVTYAEKQFDDIIKDIKKTVKDQ